MEAFKLNKVKSNPHQMHMALQSYGGKRDDTNRWVIMSETTFKKWLEEKSKKELDSDQVMVMRRYIREANERTE